MPTIYAHNTDSVFDGKCYCFTEEIKSSIEMIRKAIADELDELQCEAVNKMFEKILKKSSVKYDPASNLSIRDNMLNGIKDIAATGNQFEISAILLSLIWSINSIKEYKKIIDRDMVEL